MKEIIFAETTGIPQTTIITISVSVLAVILVAGFGFFMWLRQQDQIDRFREINRLSNKIGAGIVNFVEESGFVSYASEGFFDEMGISRADFDSKFKYDFYRLIGDPKGETIRAAINENGELSAEFRLIKGHFGEKPDDFNEKASCFMISGSRVMRRGHVTVSAIVIDVTEQKKTIEKQMIEHRKFQLATELSKEVIWSYDAIYDKLVLSDCFTTLYGGRTEITGFAMNREWNNGFIFDEDAENFAAFLSRIRQSGIKLETQVRVRNKEGNYRWCKIESHPIRVGDGLNKEYVGNLIDIDDEKREFGRLENKAMRDPMTGAYNKEYTKIMINRYISEHSDSSGMLLLVDIDHFKDINDTYGHLMGDNVIIEVVKQMTRAFRANDIIGRIGGDEFVLFVCDVKDPQIQFKQARKLHEVLRTPLTVDGQTINKSASVGIALFPDHAMDYEKLLECADKALYKVKGSGRDSFIIYGND